MEFRPSLQQYLPPVVKNLLIINGLLFLATFVLQQSYNIYLPEYLALFYVESPFFQVWQIITAMFMHFDFEHIAFNMFGLWMFGYVLEAKFGSKKFLTFYMLAGIGGALFKMLISYIELHYLGNYSVLYEMGQGASGAVFGLLFAFAYLYPEAVIFFGLPIKAKYFIAILAVIGIVGSIRNANFMPMPEMFASEDGIRIGHITHLGGMLAAFVILKFSKVRYNSG